MKRYLSLLAVAAILFGAASCEDKPEKTDPAAGAPEFAELTVSPETVTVPGELSIKAVITDAAANLSTLEISDTVYSRNGSGR